MRGFSRRRLMQAAGYLPLALFLATAPAFALDKDTEAPSFDLQGTGGPVKLADYSGKLVYLDFWASWCGPCKRSFPWMNDLQKQYGAQGLQVVAVNLDAKHGDALAFLKSVPASFPIAFDPSGSVARAYAVKGMPSSALISPDGRVITMHAGFNDESRAEMEKQIRLALQKKP